MGSRNGVDHRQAQSGSGGLGGEERLTEPAQSDGVHSRTVVADADMQGHPARIEMDLQTYRSRSGLYGIFDEIEQRADQRVSVAEQLRGTHIALPAHRHALQARLGSSTQRRTQLGGRQAILQREIATGEYQHVPYLVLQLVQAILQAAGETLLLFAGQATLLQMTGIEQGGRQRR